MKYAAATIEIYTQNMTIRAFTKYCKNYGSITEEWSQNKHYRKEAALRRKTSSLTVIVSGTKKAHLKLQYWSVSYEVFVVKN